VFLILHAFLMLATFGTQDYWTMHDKLVIAPYVAGSADTSKPLAGFKAPIMPLKDRKTFLYLTASCLPYAYENYNQTKIKGGKVCPECPCSASGLFDPHSCTGWHHNRPLHTKTATRLRREG